MSILFCGFLYAASPYATITYAEGTSFLLVRGGKTTAYQVSSNEVFGLEIKPGDIIQTSASTFLELSINPISATVQIAENTSFRCDADETGTKSSGELYYGRVRAKVAKLTGTSTYRIVSPSLVAGVRGTDFGCDVISRIGSPILNRVFCFEGSVLVAEAAGTTMNTVIILKDEMVEKVVTVGKEGDAAAPASEPVLEKKDISEEVITFWKTRSFSEASPVITAAVTGAKPAVSDIGPEHTVRNKRIPNTAAIILIGLGSATCITAAVYSGQVHGDSPFIAPAQSAGIVMISSGIVLALVSTLID